MPERSSEIVVIGGGPSGLSAAWVLSSHGYPVTVVEKEAQCGGLAATRSHGRFHYDIGPHNIHTRHPHIMAFLRRNFSDSLQARPITSVIHKRGKLVPYPLRGLKVLTSLPGIRIPAATASFAWARLRMFAGDPSEDGSFETWIRNRFGGILFHEYFCDYPEKVWGLPANRIDRIVGDKRIPVIGLTELVRSAILGRPMRLDHPEFVSDNFFMKHGVGEICERLQADCASRGVKFLTGVEPLRIRATGGRIESLSLEDGRELNCRYLLSTIPIDKLTGLLESIPETVARAASELEYRSSLLVFLTASKKMSWPSSMVYFAEPAIPFSRVSDAGQLSPTMVPEGQTLLCLEAPCFTTDPIWSRPGDELARDAIALMERTGLAEAASISGSFVERVSHSYPLFRTGFALKKRIVEDFFRGFPSLLSFGRQGGFAYINVDEALDAGFRAAAALFMTESAGGTCTDWFRVGQ